MKSFKVLVPFICALCFCFINCASTPVETQTKTSVSKNEKKDPPNVVFAKKLQNLLAEDNVKGAISLFSEIPDSLKNDLDLKLLLGALYYSDSDYDNAIAVANSVLAIDSGKLDAMELISMCNHAKGDSKAYKATTDEILKNDPYNAAVNIQRAQDSAKRKKYKQAFNYYKQALKGDPENSDALFGYAQMAYYLHDDKTATNTFNKIIEKDSSNSSAYAYLGKIAYSEENYRLALEYTQKALKIEPKNYDYLLDEGSCFRYLGKNKDAINSWETAVQIEPDYFLGYAYLAGLYDEMNDFDKALENYRLVIKTNPEYYFAYEEAAILEYHAKNYKESINYFNKAYEYSQNYSYKMMIAANYLKLGDKLSAKNTLQQAMKTMDKNSTEYMLLRFYADSYSRNAESALVNKISKEDNSNKRGKMLFYLGLYYELNGNSKVAEEYYAKVTAMQAPMFFEYRIAEWGLQ